MDSPKPKADAPFYKWLCALLTLLLLGSILWGLRRNPSVQAEEPTDALGEEWEQPKHTALFSWDWNTTKDDLSALVLLMQEQGLDTLFQYIPERAASEAVLEFLRTVSRENIGVYLLDGEPEWGLDREGEEIRNVIRRAKDYNDCLAEGEGGFLGTFIDVEPYLTEAWHEDARDVMESYRHAMQSALGTARRRDLQLIACLPYDMDRYASTLADVVFSGCDALAVMNYSREDEIGQIRLESALCAAAEKPLYVIYELQAAGQHGLKDINTYHELGVAGLQQSMKALRAAYPEQEVCFAWHYDAALREILSAAEK